MNSEYGQSPIQRITRTLAGIVEECNYAQRKLLELRMDPERYVFASPSAPDTYLEFLMRTSRSLRHEPSASERAAGFRV
jgi:hypothetical protein